MSTPKFYKSARIMLLVVLNVMFYSLQAFDYNLSLGKHPVGFKMIRRTSVLGTPELISIWYPAESTGNRPTSAEVILQSSLKTTDSDSTYLSRFLSILSRFYSIETDPRNIPAFLSLPLRSGVNALEKKGRFPVILEQADPITFFEMNEYLASHGCIVVSATTSWEDVPETPLYKAQTDLLESLQDFALDYPSANKDQIYAIGFGGGIQSAIYLAMRSNKLKRIVNIDGGFFGPRSKSTTAVDYHPSKLTAPLLHLVTRVQQEDDDVSQIKALTSPMFSAYCTSKEVRHHDFTAWGRVAMRMQNDERSTIAHGTYAAVCEMALRFLLHESLTMENSYLTTPEKVH